MPTPRKSKFRPLIEASEVRVLATAGIGVHVAQPAVAAPAHAEVSAEASPTKTAAPHAAPVVHESKATATPTHRPASKAAEARQAWVKLVNMTGKNLTYEVSLYPYKNGEYTRFEISKEYRDSTQYQYSDLAASGPKSHPNFKIKFGSQSPTDLTTGSSKNTAQGYYIFMSAPGKYYVQAFS